MSQSPWPLSMVCHVFYTCKYVLVLFLPVLFCSTVFLINFISPHIIWIFRPVIHFWIFVFYHAFLQHMKAYSILHIWLMKTIVFYNPLGCISQWQQSVLANFGIQSILVVGLTNLPNHDIWGTLTLDIAVKYD